jgi:transcription initiation factor IIE alpha subunit
MTKEIIEERHKNFLACPCCNKPMKLKFKFVDRDIYIEPIHAFKCSECGKEGSKMDVYSSTTNLDEPCKDARLVCRICNNKLHKKKLGLWNRRGKKPEDLSKYMKDLLKKMKLDD